ncbi:MAG: type II toxin-antitoxin system RelE/ParE family toxin [Nanoarchaeota archaeon]
MTFEVIARKSAKKFIDDLQSDERGRVEEKIRGLANDPFPHEVVRVHGKPGEKIFRVRVGSYRILYIVDFEQKMVVIDSVDKRSRAYD